MTSGAVEDHDTAESESISRMRSVWKTVISADIFSQFQVTPTSEAIPTTENWSGVLDFISADRVAMQIADEVYEDCSWPGSVKYLYESGEREIPLSDLKGVLERESNEEFEMLAMEEWVSRAEDLGLHSLLGEYLRGVGETSLVFPRLLQQGNFF
ncbi:hypothetical protein BDV23DRAFT_184809 [Aspergillus alliaceus]|uniref:Uncharacterized protein n=1 Tax=Petromyces alliaceus TaxID=209559 RepID=A0A5N7C4T5_PETAA|nr:hypothetical protein BDV23DRAFT_184809 [Aspergillus alliaceus]